MFGDRDTNPSKRRDRMSLLIKKIMGATKRLPINVITNFTGISDPYERPADADLVVDTTDTNVDDAAEQLLAILTARGYLERPL